MKIPLPLVVMFASISLLIGGLCGEQKGKNNEREKAIKAGVATWHVIDERGNTEFRYNEPAVPNR